MQAALIEFQLESSTQNQRGFYAGYASTWRYFTRESVCAALSYEDSLWRDKTESYQPLSFSFDSTPAEPIHVETDEVLYKAGDLGDQGLLRFGRQELILPGSTFRCVVWGELPDLQLGQLFLIGKKRAPARIQYLLIEDVEVDYTSEGQLMPIQLPPNHVMSYGAFAPLVGTQRYFILKIPLHRNVPRFLIGGYAVPVVEGNV